MYTMPSDPAVILVIDSDPLTLTGIAATLDAAGYECHCARGAESAYKAASELRLDLIICDLNIDGRSGVELVAEVQRRYGEKVPAMFVSNTQAPDIVRRVHEAGAAYYLRKPFDPEVLQELVAKALWMPHLVNARIEQGQSATTAPAPAGLGAMQQGQAAE